jgi:hypothetical protein
MTSPGTEAMAVQRHSSAATVEIVMRIKSFIVASVAMVVVVAHGPATAQNCAGFTDVPDDGPTGFCPNVEWLKNRSITLGCTSATLYCPSINVTRLAMAAFMNRLGTALTPIDLAPVNAAPAVVNPTLNPVVCPTPGPGFAVAVTSFPRRAYVSGAVHLSSPAVALDVVANVLVSTNNGASWTPIANSDHYAALYPGSSPAQHVSLAPFGWVDVAVGQTVRFGIGLSRFDGAGTSVTAGCNLAVQIGNRNAGSSPLDP